MDFTPIKQTPYEIRALINKECESARAHMAQYENHPMWYVTITWESGMHAPLYIGDIICDKDTVVAMIRGTLTAVAM